MIVLIQRLLFVIGDFFNLLKWNLLYAVQILKNFFPWLSSIGLWLMDLISLIPSRLHEAGLLQTAELINVALASSCCTFIPTALNFPNVVAGIHGLGFFLAPFRLDYGIEIIICALSIRFLFRHGTKFASSKLLRLPGPK